MSTEQNPSLKDELIGRDEVCDILGINRTTLWNLERVNKGPPSIRLGRTVRYSRKLLAEYVQAQFATAS